MNNEQQGMFVEEEEKCEKEKNIQPSTSNDVKNEKGYDKCAFEQKLLKEIYNLENCKDILVTGEKNREIIKKKLADLMRENNCELSFCILYKCKLTKKKYIVCRTIKKPK